MAAEVLSPHELAQIHRSREKRCRDLGYMPLEAKLLAESDADLNLLEKLIELGCELKIAFEIVV